jgi:ribonuclease-3
MAGEARRQRLRTLLATAGAPHANPLDFELAFVHESAVKERLAERSNERLEFFGDAVLGFVVARSLYERYPDAAEGELALRKSALVSDLALAETADRLEFGPLLVLGAGLAKLPPVRRRSALADAFEAFVAALYRTCGIDVAAAFVVREHVLAWELRGQPLDDPKTLLQEWTQKHAAGVPQYALRFEGPDHERTFFAEVRVDESVQAAGSGASKKAAQRAAAARALELLAERYDDVRPREFSKVAGAQTSRGRTSKTSRP